MNSGDGFGKDAFVYTSAPQATRCGKCDQPIAKGDESYPCQGSTAAATPTPAA